MNRASERLRLATVGVEGQADVHPDLIASHRLMTSGVEALIARDDLAAILRVDTRTIDRMRSRGDLPKPDLHVSRSPRWTAARIRAWIEGGGR